MERMTPDTDKREGLGEGIYAKFVQNYEKLLEENKNLKLIQETNEKQLKNDIKERDELREENKKLKSENEELKEAMKELNNYNKFLIQENERQKSKTITVTDEDNRIILEKGEDGKWQVYGGGNVVLC